VKLTKRDLKVYNFSHSKLYNKSKNYLASLGWLQKFLLRHNFRLRVPTTVCQKPPADYAKKIADFVVYISQQREKNNYTHIYAADETAVWLDASGGTCIDERGSREVFKPIKNCIIRNTNLTC
jgi:hypothetical protein